MGLNQHTLTITPGGWRSREVSHPSALSYLRVLLAPGVAAGIAEFHRKQRDAAETKE